MFNVFCLPKWFNASVDLKMFIAKLWNKSYSELYDEDFFGKDNLTKEELEPDIYSLLQLLKDRDNKIFYSRLIYFNWSLCLACKPTIDGWCEGKYNTSKFDFVLNQLTQWNISRCFEQQFVDCQIEIEDYCWTIAEGIMVYQNAVKMAKYENMIDLVADSIDSCIEGRGIVPGSEDKRAIFNWILIDVFPAAYCQKLPEFIYTYKFRLQPNWTYQKYTMG